MRPGHQTHGPWPLTLSHHHEASHMCPESILSAQWRLEFYRILDRANNLLTNTQPVLTLLYSIDSYGQIASQLDDCVLIISDTMEISFIRQNQGCNPSPTLCTSSPCNLMQGPVQNELRPGLLCHLIEKRFFSSRNQSTNNKMKLI